MAEVWLLDTAKSELCMMPPGDIRVAAGALRELSRRPDLGAQLVPDADLGLELRVVDLPDDRFATYVVMGDRVIVIELGVYGARTRQARVDEMLERLNTVPPGSLDRGLLTEVLKSVTVPIQPDRSSSRGPDLREMARLRSSRTR